MPEQQPNKRTSSLRQASAHERELLARALRYGCMLLLFLVFASLLLSVCLPWAAEGALRRSFGEGLKAKTVLADVKAAPAWRLLAGKSDSMELMMEFDETGLLCLTQLEARWRESNVALSLMRQGRGGERDAEPVETTLIWDEARLAAYLNRVQGEVLVSRVEITPAAVSIYGSVALAGSRHNVYLSGLPKSDDLGRVLFSADSFSVEGLTETEQLRQRLCEAVSFAPDLAPLAWKVWAKQVVLADKEMNVYGGSSCCH